MSVTNYHSIGGQLTGQTTDGQRVHFFSDALGSVRATLSDSGTLENTYVYKPYGEVLGSSGSGVNPKFSWLGIWGYRSVYVEFKSKYVRARHYGMLEGIWLSLDTLWPQEPPYNYMYGSPTGGVDATGSSPSGECKNCCCCPGMFPIPFLGFMIPFVGTGPITGFKDRDGHAYSAYFLLKGEPWDKAYNGECSYEFFECSNTGPGGRDPFVWHNRTAEYFASKYHHHPVKSAPCGGSLLDYVNDEPSFSESYMTKLYNLAGRNHDKPQVVLLQTWYRIKPTADCGCGESNFQVIQMLGYYWDQQARTIKKAKAIYPWDKGSQELYDRRFCKDTPV